MKINPDRVPINLDECVSMIMDGLEEQDIKELDSMTSIISAHFGLGMYLRNSWDLWNETSILPCWFRKTLKIWHPDDMTGIILDAFWHKYKKKTFDVEKMVLKCNSHWEKKGYKSEKVIKDIEKKVKKKLV